MSSTRRSSVQVSIGAIRVGGGAPIVVQSMTNTDTADIEGTARQVQALVRAGSELVRITVNTSEAAAAVALEATGQPSLEGGFDAAGHCLRSALNARPSGLAGLRCGSGPQHRIQLVREEKKRGHF